jgi:hypothetical protein
MMMSMSFNPFAPQVRLRRGIYLEFGGWDRFILAGGESFLGNSPATPFISEITFVSSTKAIRRGRSEGVCRLTRFESWIVPLGVRSERDSTI